MYNSGLLQNNNCKYGTNATVTQIITDQSGYDLKHFYQIKLLM